jgi:hypothetical protein
MKILKILHFYLFSQPGSLGRIFWPSKEEIDYISSSLKNLPKGLLKSKIFLTGIAIFIFYWVSEIFVKSFLPKEKIFFHPTSYFFTFLVLIILIRILIFLRFKTYFRTNKFLDFGLAVLLAGILARIKDFRGSIDWIPLGHYSTDLIDISLFLGILLLIVGTIICPKIRYYRKESLPKKLR